MAKDGPRGWGTCAQGWIQKSNEEGLQMFF